MDYSEYEQSKQEKIKGFRHFFFLSVLVLVVAFIAGCTNQTQQTTGLTTLGTSSSPSPTIGATSQPSVIATPTTEIKTGNDKINEAIAAAVADGTYSDKLTYAYHAGEETVDVEVSVKDDVITSASVKPGPKAVNMSIKIINKFNAALPELVVGKKIDKLDIPKNVAGSSLTTAAFKEYLQKLIETK